MFYDSWVKKTVAKCNINDIEKAKKNASEKKRDREKNKDRE